MTDPARAATRAPRSVRRPGGEGIALAALVAFFGLLCGLPLLLLAKVGVAPGLAFRLSARMHRRGHRIGWRWAAAARQLRLARE